MVGSGSSVAEALRRAHAVLLRDLRSLRNAVKPDSQETRARLIARLATTHADLLAHFRFEEQDGYMDAVRKQAPQFEHTIQGLAKEHDQLQDGLDRLIQEARTTQTLDRTLGDKVRAWIDEVLQHEARENALVQEAFNLDIGAED